MGDCHLQRKTTETDCLFCLPHRMLYRVTGLPHGFLKNVIIQSETLVKHYPCLFRELEWCRRPYPSPIASENYGTAKSD